MVGKTRDSRSTQSANDRSRSQPANPIRDSGASRIQSPNVRVQSLPSNRHELKAWHTGSVHVRGSMHPWIPGQAGHDELCLDARSGRARRPFMRHPRPLYPSSPATTGEPCTPGCSIGSGMTNVSGCPVKPGMTNFAWMPDRVGHDNPLCVILGHSLRHPRQRPGIHALLDARSSRA